MVSEMEKLKEKVEDIENDFTRKIRRLESRQDKIERQVDRIEEKMEYEKNDEMMKLIKKQEIEMIIADYIEKHNFSWKGE